MRSKKHKHAALLKNLPYGDIDERVDSPVLVQSPVNPVVEESPASPDAIEDCGIPMQDLESASIEQLTSYLAKIKDKLSNLTNEEAVDEISIPAQNPKVIPLDPQSSGSSKRASCDEQPPEFPEEKSVRVTPEVITLSEDDDGDDETLGHLRQLALLSRKSKQLESAMTKDEGNKSDSLSGGVIIEPENDDDEDELRAQLLRSLLMKSVDEDHEKQEIEATPIEIKPVKERGKEVSRPKSKLLPPPATEPVRNMSPTLPKPVVNKPKIGNFVIKFDDDDDDDDEKNDFKSSLDSLLSSARKAASSSSTPRGSALNKLSETSQKEYLWLKEQIKAREIKAAGVFGQMQHNQEKMVELKSSIDSKRKLLPILKSKLAVRKDEVQKQERHANKLRKLLEASQKVLKQNIKEMDMINEQLKEVSSTIKSEQQEFRMIEQENSSLKIQLEGSPAKKRSALEAGLDVPSSSVPKVPKMLPPLGKKESIAIAKSSVDESKSDKSVQPDPCELPMIAQPTQKENLRITTSPVKRLVTVTPADEDMKTDDANNDLKSEVSKLTIPHLDRPRGARGYRGKNKRRLADVVGFYESIRNLMLTTDSEINVDMVDEIEGPTSEPTVSKLSVKVNRSAIEDENPLQYQSVLSHLHAYRFSKNFIKDKDQSPLDPVSCNDVDPNVIICNTELTEGACLNPGCGMQHKSKYLLDPVSKMVDILLYCPSVAGVSNKSVKRRSPRSMDKMKSFVLKLMEDMKSKGIADHELVALELIKKIKEENPSDNIAALKRKVIGKFKSRAVLTFGDFQYDFSLGSTGQPVMNFTKIVAAKDENQENQSPHADEAKAPKVRFFTDVSNENDSGSIPDVSRLKPEEIASLSLDILSKGPKNCKNEKGCKKALQVLARGLDLHPKSSLLWREYLSLFQTFQAFNTA